MRLSVDLGGRRAAYMAGGTKNGGETGRVGLGGFCGVYGGEKGGKSAGREPKNDGRMGFLDGVIDMINSSVSL